MIVSDDSIGVIYKMAHLLSVDDVHNDTALQHTGKSSLDSERGNSVSAIGAIVLAVGGR